MLADNPNANGAKPQPLKLKFNFYTQRGKLIIEAQNQDNQLYIGSIDPHPMIHFDTVKELIFEGKVKIISKNEDALRIRIGTTSLELISKARNDANQLSEKLKQSNAKQKEMLGMIESQKNEIAELKQSTIDLINTVMELKKTTQTLVSENSQLKTEIKDIKLRVVDNFAYSCKNEQKLINLEKQSKKYQQQIKDIKENLIKLQTKEQINIKKQNLFGGVSQGPLFGSGIIFGSQEKTNQNGTDLFTKSNLQNNSSTNELNLFNNIKKNQQENPFRSQLFGPPKNDLFRKSNQIIQKLNQKNRSFKWCPELKSDKITINENTITLSTQSDYGEICLMDATFQHPSKLKQCWSIKIKKKTDFISLGICLRSVMEKHNFTSQNMSWLQIGHGQYSINSQGLSLNHSDKSFNNQKGSFTINQDDVITVEYDPAELKLKFTKNKSRIFFEYFEMPIILPPQNDDYHPFVLMRGQRECVELIQKNIEQEEKQQRRKMIESFKWGEQLKSQNITISGNVVTLTKELQILNRLYSQFCLLNASFSNTFKSKQSWAIKINKNKGGILLGVCLKSKMIKYNFNAQNVNWGQTGHGLYMITSSGYCYSHSQKEFNCVKKSFKFDDGDVIYIEYDPIESKLRFSKNKVDKYFELSIIAPPQNDAYLPCVELRGQNQSVELIEPTIINE